MHISVPFSISSGKCAVAKAAFQTLRRLLTVSIVYIFLQFSVGFFLNRKKSIDRIAALPEDISRICEVEIY